MSQNKEHSVRIVWDDPVNEVINYPKRDFKALNRRVRRRKFAIRIAIGTALLILLLLMLTLFKINGGSENLSEAPNSTSPYGPTIHRTETFDWSDIQTIKPAPKPARVKVTQPKIEQQITAVADDEKSAETEANQAVKSDINQGKIAISPDSIQSEEKPEVKTAMEKLQDPGTKQPVNTFVPSEFVRAYPTVGYDSLNRYLTEFINKELLGSNNESDTLRISFAIEVDGRPSGIQLSIETTDSVFMRIEEVVQNMPVWQPATADGQPIKTRFRLPLIIQSKVIIEEEE